MFDRFRDTASRLTAPIENAQFARPGDAPAQCLLAFVLRLTRLFALTVSAIATLGVADASTFTIAKLYSDQPGDVQYIELHDTSTDGNVGPLAGSVITVRHADVVKRYVIPTDPPPGFQFGGTLLLATVDDVNNDDWWGPVPVIPPDYIMPARFLPTDGGTIDLDGEDPWTFDSLPTEGSLALLRSGETTTSTTHSFSMGNAPIGFGAGFAAVLEYYDPDVGQYFYTASEPDIDALESGRIPGWKATGNSLPAYTGPTPECCSMYGLVPVPVCRYFVPPAGHFFSAFPEECDAVLAQFPSAALETRAAFYVVLPTDAETGKCPWPVQPVYRLWNTLTNAHVFVTDAEQRLNRIAEGWIPEGYGPAGVAWCY